MKKKDIVVAVSGGFDPLHVGHVRMFKKARALGTKLIVILNNDNWLETKKGYIFMKQRERKEIISALKMVDDVYITTHKKNDPDRSVCTALRRIRPNIFANGGDRSLGTILETETCRIIGARMVCNVGGGKVQSSSWLVNNTKKRNAV
jgi:cytidyltransferase-like protein